MTSKPQLLELSRLFLRRYHRPFVRGYLQEADLSPRLNVVVGQRGVGKTTAAVQHLLSKAEGDHLSTRILYVPADHFLVIASSLYEIAQDFERSGGEHICFDEVHRYPQWSRELKSIHDTFLGLRILATGSSALEISRGSHDLSRRAITHDMPGLSLREFIEIDGGPALDVVPLPGILEDHERVAAGIVDELERRKMKILERFGRYLRCGYYPYFLEVGNEETFFTLLEQNIRTAVEVDLPAVMPTLTGESIRKLERLLAVIAGAVPLVPNLKALGEIIGVADPRTIKGYLEQLQRVGVLRLVPRHGRPFDSLAKPEKIYLDNPNAQFALSSVALVNVGTLRETFFASQVGARHRLTVPRRGDFVVDDRDLFEVGGRGKGGRQIRGVDRAFLALDDIEIGSNNRIPLWLFGFLY